MNKLLSLILFLFIAVPAFCRDFSYTYEGQTIKYTVIDEDAKTCKTRAGRNYRAGNNISGNLFLPDHPKDGDKEYTLTEIGDMAFYECKELSSVIIPNTVETIGESAFQYCDTIMCAVIGNSVKTIGYNAFSFNHGHHIAKTAYPNTIENPFHSYYYDGVICYPADNSIIEDGCIYDSDKTIIYFAPISIEGEFAIPNSVKTIGDDAFYYCKKMEAISIPNSVEEIGNNVFYRCERLEAISIPGSVKKIGNDILSGCDGLEIIDFASIESMCKIEYKSYWANPLRCALYLYIDGEEINDLVIPETVTSIGKYAFYGCPGLTSVTIPESVQIVGEEAFGECTDLKKAKFPSIETLCKINFGNYAANPLWNAHHLYIGDKELTEPIIPNSVTEIGNNAFAGGSNLTQINIPNSITTIGAGAFYGCTALTLIDIPNSVTTIGGMAFYGCTGITSIDIPYSVTTIGPWTFGGCKALTSIEIPNTITKIDYLTFEDCTSLTTITIPNSVKVIDFGAFNNCRSLTSVTLSNSLQAVSNSIFKYCYKINFIQYLTDNPIQAASSIFENSIYNSAELIIPQGALDAFSQTNPWNMFQIITEIEWDGIDDIICDGTVGEIDYNAPYEVYNLNGVKVAADSLDGLNHGFYIIRQGRVAKKIAVK